MNHLATGLAILCVFVIVALFAGKFVAFGDGPRPMSEEELDRAALHAFYREIAILLIGLVLGAALFCLFAGYAIANQLTN